MQTSFLTLFAAWVIQLLFWAGAASQVWLQTKLKTARGLSDLTLFFYFNGYISYCYYVYSFDFPLSYRVMVPISTITMLILLTQRFAYEQGYKKDKKLLLFYLCNGCVALAIFPYLFTHTLLFGNIMGWISISIWLVHYMPQFVKIHTRKSVYGFSFLLVSLIGLGDFIEFILALCLGFPLQTKLNGLRGISTYLIFCVQFWLYKDRTPAYEPASVDERGVVVPPAIERDQQRESDAQS